MPADIKDILTGILIVGMLFFIIPIRIDNPGKSKSSFNNYIKRFNKSYDKSEYDSRYQNFKTALLMIDKLNEMNSGVAKFGLTQFSDMSEEEFLNYRLDLQPLNARRRRKHKYHQTKELVRGVRFERDVVSVEVPNALDWRDHGVVSGVRDQGLCGACWAHSTVASIESRLAILSGALTELSVEEMIDCARFGNFGCNGGDICSLLVWLQSLKVPILKQSEYSGGSDGKCTLNPQNHTSNINVTVKGYSCEDLSKQENAIVNLLAKQGPVAVAVNALPWQHYLGGIIQYHCSGAPEDLNHAVQLVGYNLTAPVPYYIARNSWGSLFGDAGYLKLAMGTNVCGVANEVASVDVNH